MELPFFTNATEEVAFLLVGRPKRGGMETIQEIFLAADSSHEEARSQALAARDEISRERGDFYWEVEVVESGDTFEIMEQGE